MTRKEIRKRLHSLGIYNPFTVRNVSFQDLAKADSQVVTIKQWKPSGLVDAVKINLWPCIVMFEG